MNFRNCLRCSSRRMLTYSSGNLLRTRNTSPASVLSLMDGNNKALPKPEDMPEAKMPVFIDFLENVLVIDPGDRKSAAEMLKHPWLAAESVTAT